MTQPLLLWDLYELSSKSKPLTGIKLRGSIRKFGIESETNILAENAEDTPGNVRFAVLIDTDITAITQYTRSIVADIVEKVLSGISNPILSKFKANDITRYS